MSRPKDSKLEPLTTDEVETALAALDAGPPPLVEPAIHEPPECELFEADPASVSQAPPSESEGQVQMTRDAFGNRTRLNNEDELSQNASTDLKARVEMCGLSPDLAQKVLSGSLNLQTARTIQLQRRKAATTLSSSLPPVKRILLFAAAIAAMAILLKLISG